MSGEVDIADTQSQKSVQQISVTPCSVILVDDDMDDRNFAIKKLEKSKLVQEVLALPSGMDLISYMKQEGFYDHSVIRYSPVLILLDMQMPKMNGLDVIRDIRSDSFLKDIPIIVLSGQKHTHVIGQAFALGANGYLKKPLRLNKVEGFLPQAWQWPPPDLW
ncbi:MAG: response regulator [Alphaproteobacteria bacterium]|nr:response regulator [Alphaproteobacteria bacterium]